MSFSFVCLRFFSKKLAGLEEALPLTQTELSTIVHIPGDHDIVLQKLTFLLLKICKTSYGQFVGLVQNLFFISGFIRSDN